MKIGLIRHFKVKHSFPDKLFLSKSEVIKWFEDYETAELERKDVDLAGIHWKRCYSSPLNRTVYTSNQIYTGEIIEVAELKELDILQLLPDRIKLPFMVWGLFVRMKSFSSAKDVHIFKHKIIGFLDNVLLKEDGNVLVVSHWFVMKVLQKELLKRGLAGDVFKSPDYGKLYVFKA